MVVFLFDKMKALHVFLGVENDVFIEILVHVLFWVVTDVREEGREGVDELQDVGGDFSEGLVGLDNLPDGLSGLTIFFGVDLFASCGPARLTIPVVPLVVAEVFIPHKHFVLLHV